MKKVLILISIVASIGASAANLKTLVTEFDYFAQNRPGFVGRDDQGKECSLYIMVSERRYFARAKFEINDGLPSDSRSGFFIDHTAFEKPFFSSYLLAQDSGSSTPAVDAFGSSLNRFKGIKEYFIRLNGSKFVSYELKVNGVSKYRCRK